MRGCGGCGGCGGGDGGIGCGDGGRSGSDYGRSGCSRGGDGGSSTNDSEECSDVYGDVFLVMLVVGVDSDVSVDKWSLNFLTSFRILNDGYSYLILCLNELLHDESSIAYSIGNMVEATINSVIDTNGCG